MKHSLFGFAALALAAIGLLSATLTYKPQPKASQGRIPASMSLDFNQMIEESQKDSAELNAQFQKNAGIQKKVLNAGKLSPESKEIPATPEQFAAKSSSELFAHSAPEIKKDEKAEMKRLSQELQEVEN